MIVDRLAIIVSLLAPGGSDNFGKLCVKCEYWDEVSLRILYYILFIAIFDIVSSALVTRMFQVLEFPGSLSSSGVDPLWLCS